MIYTVTLNPSIDYIVHVDQLTIGAVNRMKNDLKLPGGKGINVSRILKRIKHESTALGFIGGFTGNFINEWMKQENIQTNFTTVADDTRINIKLKAHEETEINGQGPLVSTDEMNKLKKILENLTAADIVVLSGSKPASVPTGFYQELIEIITSCDAEFVIDTTGADLMDALEKRPLLVKPNNHELAELYQTTFNSVEDIYPFGQRLLDEGAQYALVSMAGDGALLFTQNGIYRSNVLNRPVKNSVGAGDSMIAGFVGNFTQTKDPVEAFKWGVACGSATTFSDDLATAAFIQELLPEVQITQVQ
ncbi:1-phosphofructokinase [Enterococcus dongliensis]|uniref:Tagatose-6-phosphate kinase n=1 Tax=Enterococcus dongliensis TaxID=2559925 RepID=A0AAP5KP94_9ENTE|nr:1-phosphofructokinase [Enterococcus dongliensis]MDT2595857.1 1-phosphofructokinase [Enterococcus dongliensis]MDT2602882.1 1-phosphofructokinase [Enterococcus dongliensis]MDT2633924.1 1-phosphofructokinase [Enterococcus dongliensis]MDT2637314.1 1-phosphofructokinase [Enterococcus dongliensis]MDT2639654.1 1-phosphofructokinase [Enterococcus dongliensis]